MDQGSDLVVDARPVSGTPFAVHREATEGIDVKLWVITHCPTGRALGVRIFSRSRAEKAARELWEQLPESAKSLLAHISDPDVFRRWRGEDAETTQRLVTKITENA